MTKANTVLRPSSSGNIPESDLTPLRVPVFARIVPEPGPDKNTSRKVPVLPAVARADVTKPFWPSRSSSCDKRLQVR